MIVHNTNDDGSVVMDHPCDRTDILLSALHRQKIIGLNLSVREEGSEAVLAFHWIGLRRHRRHGSFYKDDTAELSRRLTGIFPGLSELSISIDTVAHGRRWNRLVQFRVNCDDLEYTMQLQPVERSCA